MVDEKIEEVIPPAIPPHEDPNIDQEPPLKKKSNSPEDK